MDKQNKSTIKLSNNRILSYHSLSTLLVINYAKNFCYKTCLTDQFWYLRAIDINDYVANYKLMIECGENKFEVTRYLYSISFHSDVYTTELLFVDCI